jgi:hypothetical protein
MSRSYGIDTASSKVKRMYDQIFRITKDEIARMKDIIAKVFGNPAKRMTSISMEDAIDALFHADPLFDVVSGVYDYTSDFWTQKEYKTWLDILDESNGEVLDQMLLVLLTPNIMETKDPVLIGYYESLLKPDSLDMSRKNYMESFI